MLDPLALACGCLLRWLHPKSLRPNTGPQYITGHSNYIYSSRDSAEQACQQTPDTRLCYKAEVEGFRLCAAGWMRDFIGYWMPETASGCGTGRGFRSSGRGTVGAYCCGPGVDLSAPHNVLLRAVLPGGSCV